MWIIGAVAVFLMFNNFTVFQTWVTQVCILIADNCNSFNIFVGILAIVCVLATCKSRFNLGKSKKNAGILAVEFYFPSLFYQDRSPSQYESGLISEAHFQECCCASDREDINSASLSAVQMMLDKNKIPKHSIGMVEISGKIQNYGTSKILQKIFEDFFNPKCSEEEFCSPTSVNCAENEVAALSRVVCWAESSAWDGRYAIIVVAEEGKVAKGFENFQSGFGAVSLLVGLDAPLVFNARTCSRVIQSFASSYRQGCIDSAQAPSSLLQIAYNSCLQKCFFQLNVKKGQAKSTFDFFVNSMGSLDKTPTLEKQSWSEDLMHAQLPVSARLTTRFGFEGTALALWCDFLGLVGGYGGPSCSKLEVGKTVTFFKFIGTPSHSNCDEIADGWIFELHTRRPFQSKFSLQEISRSLNLENFLAQRWKLSDEEFDAVKAGNAALNTAEGCYQPLFPIEALIPGAFYIATVGPNLQRTYSRKKMEAAQMYPSKLIDKIQLRKGLHFQARAPSSIYGLQKPMTAGTEMVHTACSAKSPKKPVPAFPQSPHLDLFNFSNTYDNTSCGTIVPIAEAQTNSFSFSENKAQKKNLRPSVLVVGVSAGLPGTKHEVFAENNLDILLQGENRLDAIDDSGIQEMLEKNVVLLKRRPDGGPPERIPINSRENAVKVNSRLGNLNMSKYGIKPSVVDTMDSATRIAVAAGLEALRDAGLVKGSNASSEDWQLAPELRAGTGVVYATSFPAMDAVVSELTRYSNSQSVRCARPSALLNALVAKFEGTRPEGLSAKEEDALAQVRAMIEKDAAGEEETQGSSFEFDRKFLFRVLCLGNSQLAELVKAQGPNFQTNGACAGTTQAIAIAQDLLATGRAERMIVIAGDDASNSSLSPWVGNGFRALGAAALGATPEECGLPFDQRRKGMVLGAGAVGLVLETNDAALRRWATTEALSLSAIVLGQRARCMLLATHISNSAYHGASMDRFHIAAELATFLDQLEKDHAITKTMLATMGVYLSHETSTNASAEHSCAANEVYALRQCFGEDLSQKFLMLNTKGFYGHPMAVSFEDVAAVEILRRGIVPPVANFKQQDSHLGPLNISSGGAFPARYALRFAAGFGSQVAFALYASTKPCL